MKWVHPTNFDHVFWFVKFTGWSRETVNCYIILTDLKKYKKWQNSIISMNTTQQMTAYTTKKQHPSVSWGCLQTFSDTYRYLQIWKDVKLWPKLFPMCVNFLLLQRNSGCRYECIAGIFFFMNISASNQKLFSFASYLIGSEETLRNTVVQAWLHYLKSKKCWIYWFWYLHLGLYFKYIVKEKIKCNYLLKMMLNKCEFCPRLSLNTLAKLRRHASRVHFAKIHFR